MLQFFALWFTPCKACKGLSFMKKLGHTLGSRPQGSLILVKAVVSGFTLHFTRVNDGAFESTGPMLRARANPFFGESSPTLDPYSTPKSFSLPHRTMCFKRYSTTTYYSHLWAHFIFRNTLHIFFHSRISRNMYPMAKGIIAWRKNWHRRKNLIKFFFRV
jgi:hypothetical protein